VNLGDDVFYSGTVAAAREAALKGIPALAVSAAPSASFHAAADVASRLAEELAREERPLLLNVNFPPGEQWPLRATRLGRRIYDEVVDFRRDPRDREYLWIGGSGVSHRPLAGADTEAFDSGVVGVTPLVLDLWSRLEQERIDELVEVLSAPATT
jgi:5'-nucleotidase